MCNTERILREKKLYILFKANNFCFKKRKRRRYFFPLGETTSLFSWVWGESSLKQERGSQEIGAKSTKRGVAALVSFDSTSHCEIPGALLFLKRSELFYILLKLFKVLRGATVSCQRPTKPFTLVCSFYNESGRRKTKGQEKGWTTKQLRAELTF